MLMCSLWLEISGVGKLQRFSENLRLNQATLQKMRGFLEVDITQRQRANVQDP